VHIEIYSGIALFALLLHASSTSCIFTARSVAERGIAKNAKGIR